MSVIILSSPPIPPWGRSLLAVILLAAALMVPAFWNGYPILYFDTVDYVSFGFTWKLPVYRTAGYGFLAMAGWGARTIWATLVLQSLYAAYVLYESWRLLFSRLRGLALACVLAFALILTSLPWVASAIMPDIFAAPAVLLTLILALRGSDLSPTRQWVFILLLAVACIAHPTHITVVAGLILCIACMSRLAKHGWPFATLRVRSAASGLVLGIVLSLTANWAATGRIFLAPQTTPLLTFAVMLEKGVGQRYLADTCGRHNEPQSVLCPYRNDLPRNANEFLWHDPNFWKAGGWNVLIPAASRDMKAIVTRYPLQFLGAVAQLFAEQLVVIRTGEGFRTMVGFIDRQIRQFYPRDYEDFLAAQQQRYPEIWDSPLPEINFVHVPVMLAGVLLLLAVLIRAIRRKDEMAVTLASLILLAYLGNAFVCGAISNPADRYGTRLAWLVAMAAVALLPQVMGAGRREKSYVAG